MTNVETDSPSEELDLESLPPKERAGALIELLKTPVEPVTQSLGYKLGIIVITVVMLFLFLVYLGMIVGVAGAVVYHVTQNLWLLATPGGLWGLVAFVFPMIVGPILLLFMIKPIVSKPVQRSPTRALKRN